MATIEWIMAELLLHPDKLSKAKSEIRAVIRDKKLIEDSDISKLPYLQAVMKEAFRLHPPGPLLIPRAAERDMEIRGYFIPKGARILCNVWAMGRDPSIWPNPDSFEPERFLDNKIDYKGLHAELIPFGSGRRVCPGIPLAHRIMHATVAALIGNFDWEFAEGEKDRNGEFFGGLALQREAPLIVVPVKP